MVANREINDTWSQRFNHAGAFVTKHRRKWMLRVTGHDMPVAMAHPGSTHADTNLVRLWFC